MTSQSNGEGTVRLPHGTGDEGAEKTHMLFSIQKGSDIWMITRLWIQ